MNHIVKLRRNNEAKDKALVSIQETINMFRAHLCSSKFYQDTTIQVSDVNRWLDSIVRNGQDTLDLYGVK